MRIFASLLLVAGTALAQDKEPERRPLNLKLENPGAWATTADPEKDKPETLPSLGGDARTVPQAPAPKPERQSPYPSDTNPLR